MPEPISFVVFCKPEPQGSSKAVMPKGARFPKVTSANGKLYPYRQQVARTALAERKCSAIPFGHHEPVTLGLRFFFQKPPSVPKKRTCHVVKPDLDKLVRGVKDALTGIIYEDDSQVVSIRATKHYGAPERVELVVSEYAASGEEYVATQPALLQQQSAIDDF